MDDSPFFRYRRQTLLDVFDEKSQRKLSESSAVLIGCGGLGTVIASYIVRAGIGQLTIVDHDVVSLDNLQRQMLFDEQDVQEKLNKADAAASKLRKINSDVEISAVSEKLTQENVRSIFAGADLVLDATDDMYTRFTINETCIELNIPWIYGGVVSTYGNSFTIIPGQTACLKCFIDEIPEEGAFPGCSDVGVLGPAVSLIASIQVSEGLKLLCGKRDDLIEKMINVDLWNGDWELSEIERNPGCAVCGRIDN